MEIISWLLSTLAIIQRNGGLSGKCLVWVVEELQSPLKTQGQRLFNHSISGQIYSCEMVPLMYRGCKRMKDTENDREKLGMIGFWRKFLIINNINNC